MNAVLDFFRNLGGRLGRLPGMIPGIGRRREAGGGGSDQGGGGPRRKGVLRLLIPVLLLLLVVHFATMTWRFAFNRGIDLAYPEDVIYPEGEEGVRASRSGPVLNAGERDPTGDGCIPSRVVSMQNALIDLLVNKNDWVPATPQYTVGVFGLGSWAATPWFDNKAYFQIGVLTALRRVSLDLADTIGRVRGTSGADPDLQGAASRLRVNERAWVLNNPFDPQLQMLQASAAGSYRGAIELYDSFNMRLAACDAMFDARADNLLRLIDRFAADLGDLNDRLQKRSRAVVWSHEQLRFVEGEGNNLGWFDFHADNLLHEARGQMYALHGLLQAARVDFAVAVENSQLDAIWDRMEAHIADGARMSPLIVSNGRTDGLILPSHLAVMGEKVLRARANMTELRDVLQN